MNPFRLARTLAAASAVAVLAPACATAGAAAEKAPAAGFQPDANMARADVPDGYKWKLAPLFASDDAFDAELTALADARAKLRGFAGTLAEPARLRECLDLYFDTRLRTNKVTLYANLRFDGDDTDPKLQAMSQRSLSAMNDLMAQTSFIRREIMAIDDAAMAAAYDAEPKLAEYRPYIEDLRRRRSRVLDAEAERVLGLMGDNLFAEIDLNELPSPYEQAFKGLLGDLVLPKITDEDGHEVQLTLSNYGRYRGSADRRVRRDAVEGLFGALRRYQDAFAGTFGGQVGLNIAFARARGYDTVLDAYMDRDDIDPKVYKSLIASMRANLGPLHRYVQLRKRVMGLKDLHIYDLYTPLVPAPQENISYDEAAHLVPKALAPLGDEYLRVLAEGLDPKNGWIDVYPNAHKESGAFCASTYGVHPFVKLNYMNDFDGVSTLAHEYGHALHSYFTMSRQPYVTSNYASFVAEIASTFNEKLLIDYLLKNAKTPAERLALLGEMVEKIRTTIYRQTLFAEFELRVHTAAEKGKPITADFLNSTYAQLVHDYYGPDFTVGENDGLEWAYVPHFYYKYYMYSYACGLSAGIALAEKVENGGPEAQKAYLGMLKAGSSKPPVEIVKAAGVDLTTPEAFEAAAHLMNRLLDEMETLLPAQAAK